MEAESRPDARWPAWSGFAALLVGLVCGEIALVVLAVAEKAAGADPTDKSPGLLVPGTVLFQLALVGCAFAFAASAGPVRLSAFGLRPTRIRTALKWMGIAVAIYILFGLAYVAAFHPESQSTLEDLGAGRGGSLVTIGIALAVVGVAPWCEELFFRGFFFGALRNRMSFLPAAALAGLAFGAVHAPTGPQAIPPLAVLGIAFCLVYEATGSILPTICLHSLNNMVAFGVDKHGSFLAGGITAALVIAVAVMVGRRAVS